MNSTTREAGPLRTVRSRLARMPVEEWVLLYAGIYTSILVVSSLIQVSYFTPSSSPRGQAIGFWILVTIFFRGPFTILPFAAILSLLWWLGRLRPWQFRLAAVPLCCLPSACVADPYLAAISLSTQVLIAIFMVQPARQN